MKKLFIVLVAFSFFLGLASNTEAYVSVKGYYRSNGTYVQPHVRSNPNGLKYDNYSYKPSQGLYNPSYGTRGSTWDTPTYITDPNYYEGKSLYESGSAGLTNTPDVPSIPSYPSYSGSDGYSYVNPYSNRRIDGGYYIGSSLFCDSGYYKRNDSCIKAPQNSTAYGLESFYCDYGYRQVNDYCEKNPENSYSVGSNIYCNSGYVFNSSKTACITYNAACNEINNGFGLRYQNGNCSCDSGYEWSPNTKSCVLSVTCNTGYIKNNNQCITHTDNCRLTYGENAIGTEGPN